MYIAIVCEGLHIVSYHYVVLLYSHSKSVVPLFLCTLIHCTLLLAPLIAISQTVHCLLLVYTSLTTTIGSLSLVQNTGAVDWRRMFSEPLGVSQSGSVSPKHLIHSRSIARGGEF